MRNNVICKIIGVGAVWIRIYDGIIRTQTNVRHNPYLKKNLIALDVLDSNGCKIKNEYNEMKIFHGAIVVMRVRRTESLYILSKEKVTSLVAVSFTVSETKIVK